MQIQIQRVQAGGLRFFQSNRPPGKVHALTRQPHLKSQRPTEPVVNTYCSLPKHTPFPFSWFQTLGFFWEQSPPCSLCFYFGSNGPQCLGRKQVTWVCSIPDPGFCGRLEAGPGSVGCSCKRPGWADTSSTQLFTFWSFPGVPSLTEAQALPSAI